MHREDLLLRYLASIANDLDRIAAALEKEGEDGCDSEKQNS